MACVPTRGCVCSASFCDLFLASPQGVALRAEEETEIGTICKLPRQRALEEGKVGCFKLDFFCLCVVQILFIQFPVPANTQKIENEFYQIFPDAISSVFHLI